MTDTDPTPERRWTLESPPYGRFELDGTPQFAHTVLAALNEAETLRAEKAEWVAMEKAIGSNSLTHFVRETQKRETAMRERVRVLEDALREHGKCRFCYGTGKPGCRCEAQYCLHPEQCAAICHVCKGDGLEPWVGRALAGADGGERRGG